MKDLIANDSFLITDSRLGPGLRNVAPLEDAIVETWSYRAFT